MQTGVKIIRRRRHSPHVPLHGGLWTRRRMVHHVRAIRSFALWTCAAFVAMGLFQALLLCNWRAAGLAVAPTLGISAPLWLWAHFTLRGLRTDPRRLRARRTWYAPWRKAGHG